ncbi:MAG: glycoside hydrolase family 16 protein [Coprobacillus sp.]|nr:glycoside hydrolase family 16 protein [Coprobacillus sp.]
MRVSKLILVPSVVLLSISSITGCNETSHRRYEPYVDQTQFSLIFEDEFDLDHLDESKWEYMIGNGEEYGNVGWGNEELEYYTDENATFENSEMTIHIRREDYKGYKYTSTRIRSKGKMYTKYGRIEALISLPMVQGMWPAFWMLPEDNTPYGIWAASGEIDIMEARGRVTDMTSCALHYGQEHTSTYTTKTYIMSGNDNISNYHWYALEWFPDYMVWYVDDDEVMRMNSTGINCWWTEADYDNPRAPFDTEFHMLINCAVGGHFDGYLEPEDDFRECEMKIDCVRMYEYIGEVD